METRALHRLIRRKITATVFEQMFREAGRYTVIPIGHADSIETLSEHKRHPYVRKILENLTAAPDYVLISQDKTDVMVVEVDYMRRIDRETIADRIHTILRRWDPSYLFLATGSGFYYENCTAIRAENGSIKRLTERWVRKDIQDKYYHLLEDYIR
ncbi:MAG: hypothetical protein N2691_02080 [Patescibacteria group bacterium]|nr:hypothetical protein [Patescibacteria group bacterium]